MHFRGATLLGMIVYGHERREDHLLLVQCSVTDRAGLVLADISRAEVLNGQTLQLHVKAPEPLSRLVSTCTLQL